MFASDIFPTTIRRFVKDRQRRGVARSNGRPSLFAECAISDGDVTVDPDHGMRGAESRDVLKLRGQLRLRVHYFPVRRHQLSCRVGAPGERENFLLRIQGPVGRGPDSTKSISALVLELCVLELLICRGRGVGPSVSPAADPGRMSGQSRMASVRGHQRFLDLQVADSRKFVLLNLVHLF